MADRSAEPWYATAAYLYVLHLDGPALAWSICAAIQTIGTTGCAVVANRMLLGIGGYACWKIPLWMRGTRIRPVPDHDAVVQLYPDADPPPAALCFEFRKLPGQKHLIHDGKRLVLVVRWPGCCLRFVLAPGLDDGMAYAYAIRACAAPCERYAAGEELNKIAVATGAAPAATVRPRPPLSALLELHTLQALDATLAGASLREVAEGLFGADAVAADWHKDSALRAR
ncbi:DUF2285 domain-containing protein, partial [Enterobacter mori]